MFSSCLKDNQPDQRQAGLRGHRVIPTWGKVSTMAARLRAFANYSVCVWGALMFIGFMGVVAAEGTSSSPSQPSGLVITDVADDNSRHIEVNRRDPFKRIPKHRPTPKVSTQSHPESKIVPLADIPVWRLLGVMHGQNGHQAVIQVSPTERVLVKPGSELTRSGWIIKTISEGEVLLERRSIASSVAGAFPPRTFILSFPSLQKAP